LAYIAWDDISEVTYDSTDLKAYVRSISGLKQNVTLDDFHPAGAAWPTPVDTGLRSHDPIVLECMFDGGATAPGVKLAVGTSATLTITLATGISVSGTFIVSDVEVTTSADGVNKLNATLTPSGTITTDLTT